MIHAHFVLHQNFSFCIKINIISRHFVSYLHYLIFILFKARLSGLYSNIVNTEFITDFKILNGTTATKRLAFTASYGMPNFGEKYRLAGIITNIIEIEPAINDIIAPLYVWIFLYISDATSTNVPEAITCIINPTQPLPALTETA